MAVDVAGDGEEGVARAEATEYDAIILDVMLPGIDGFEVCRRLRGDGVLGSDPDAHRARRGRGPRRGPRQRRGRLPHQALLLRGAPGAPARPGPPRCRWSARPSCESATSDSTRRAGRPGAGKPRSRSRPRSSRSSRHSCAGPARCSRASSCSSTPGTTTTRTAPTWSTPTSGCCAARSTGPFGTGSIETVRGAGYRLREDGGRLSRLADQAPRHPRLRRDHGDGARRHGPLPPTCAWSTTSTTRSTRTSRPAAMRWSRRFAPASFDSARPSEAP